MNLADARNSIKELADALNSLASASLGIKDADFDGLQARKTALESSLADLRKKVQVASDQATLDIINAEAAAKEKKSQLAAEVAKMETALNELQGQTVTAREAMQAQLREYRAKEIGAKSAELKSLNEQVEQRQKVLDEINTQVEAGRKRFA